MRKVIVSLLFIFCITIPCFSRDITVAIIGSGIDTSDKIINNNFWVNSDEVLDGIDNDGNGYIDDIMGWNFLDNNNQIYNTHSVDWHETYVAQDLIQNSNHFTSEGNKVKIMPIKIYETTNTVTLSRGITINLLTDVINYAIKNGADIISLSMDFNLDNPSIINNLIASNPNILFVQSSGNTSSDYNIKHNGTINSYPNKLLVGAYKGPLDISNYSDFGNSIDIYADGRHYFQKDNGLYMVEGTSFAVPKVVAMCIKEMILNSNITSSEVKVKVIQNNG